MEKCLKCQKEVDSYQIAAYADKGPHESEPICITCFDAATDSELSDLGLEREEEYEDEEEEEEDDDDFGD